MTSACSNQPAVGIPGERHKSSTVLALDGLPIGDGESNIFFAHFSAYKL